NTKKGKRSRWVGNFAVGRPGRFHSKGGTAAKSSHLKEVNQGWPLMACSAFSAPAWSRSQKPSAGFPFFLNHLFLFPFYLLW
ncbi:hypothetical protein EDM58_24755, partial [Brevibacillus panacihumi]